VIIDRDNRCSLVSIPRHRQRSSTCVWTAASLHHVPAIKQYRPWSLEVSPDFPKSTERCRIFMSAAANGPRFLWHPSSLRSIQHLWRAHQSQYPSVRSHSISLRMYLGPGNGGHQQAQRSINFPHHQREFPGNRTAFQSSLASQPILILAAAVTVYIVWACSRRLHPSHPILSTLLRWSRRHSGFAVDWQRTERNGKIGIILFIGLVKECNHDDRFSPGERSGLEGSRRSIYEACLRRFGPS